MRIALIADIHSNLVALQAVLADIRRHQPDRIISLGDQVNLGPKPREVLDLLHKQNVACLHGNHERYILSAMQDDPGYRGANFASLRYNASLLKPEEIKFPKFLQIGGVLFTHALPEDDRFPVFDPEKAIPALRKMQFDEPTHIVCGHGHNPTHLRAGNVTLDSIGSVGCMDDAIPGVAPYAILYIDEHGAALRPYYAKYDTTSIKPMFLSSPMPKFCPIMARIACTQMMTNKDVLCPFVDSARALSGARGEAQISERTWQDADAAFAWADGLTTAGFWQAR